LETEPVTALAAAALADCSQQHLVMNRKTFKGSSSNSSKAFGSVIGGSPMTYQSSTWFLPRLIGLRRAKELILLNRLLSAAEALGLGLVNRVVAPEELSANPRGQLLDVYLG